MKNVLPCIPMGVNTEVEFPPASGKGNYSRRPSVRYVFGLVVFLIWLLSRSVSGTVVTALAGIAGSVMMTAKDQSNLSVLDQIQHKLFPNSRNCLT